MALALSLLQPIPLFIIGLACGQAGCLGPSTHGIRTILALELGRPFLKVLAKLNEARDCAEVMPLRLSRPPQAHLCEIHPWTDLIDDWLGWHDSVRV